MWSDGTWCIPFFFTVVTGPRRSLSLKLSDPRVYELWIRAHLGNHNTPIHPSRLSFDTTHTGPTSVSHRLVSSSALSHTGWSRLAALYLTRVGLCLTRFDLVKIMRPEVNAHGIWRTSVICLGEIDQSPRPLEIARHPILKVTFKRVALPLEPF